MTIHDHFDSFEVECDICGCTQEHDKDITAHYGENNGFEAMIESLKEDGWGIHKSEETGEWIHLCPDDTDWEE